MTKVLELSVSQEELEGWGFSFENTPKITFNDLVKKIKRQLAFEALRRCQKLAKKYGISEMTLDEINAEIKAARHAKISH